MATNTPRHGLPTLFVAQAQKEVTHNEALLRIDALLHSSVEASLSTPPILSTQDAGKCWLIAEPATADWLGKENQVACWTGEGWRYLQPREGMRIWRISDSLAVQFAGGTWRSPASIADPDGGSNVDSEARTALMALLTELRHAGLVA